jgi:hypothetical protein
MQLSKRSRLLHAYSATARMIHIAGSFKKETLSYLHAVGLKRELTSTASNSWLHHVCQRRNARRE